MMMEVTFLVGNGFDLNLGLKTSYRDFVAYYTDEEQSQNDNMVIKEFKRTLKYKFKKDLWADLELFIGEYSGYLIDEEKYSDCLVDITEKLSVYLLGVQNVSFEIDEKSAVSFVNGLTPYFKTQLNYFHFLDTTKVKFNFVNFNYTNTLQKCAVTPLAEMCKKVTQKTHQVGEYMHIHGTTEEYMILGVDNSSQITNYDIFKDKESAYHIDFIKSQSNDENNQLKEERLKRVLRSSDIIYIYGLSLGETDATWWREILKRMEDYGEKKVPPQLIIDMYEPKFKHSPVHRDKRRLQKNGLKNCLATIH